MDHIVYVDAKAKEMEALLEEKKTMIVRGAAGRKVPYGKVNSGDILYFIRNNAEGLILGKAVVSNVLNSEKLTTEESKDILASHQNELQLTDQQIKRWGGKRYLVLVSINPAQSIEPMAFDRNRYSNSMDDWLIIENIDEALKQ